MCISGVIIKLVVVEFGVLVMVVVCGFGVGMCLFMCVFVYCCNVDVDMLYMYCFLLNKVMMYIVKKVGMEIYCDYGEVDVYFKIKFVNLVMVFQEVLEE